MDKARIKNIVRKVLSEIKINNPNQIFKIETEEDKNKLIKLSKEKGWIFYTGDRAEDVIEVGEEYKLINHPKHGIILYPKNEEPYKDF